MNYKLVLIWFIVFWLNQIKMWLDDLLFTRWTSHELLEAMGSSINDVTAKLYKKTRDGFLNCFEFKLFEFLSENFRIAPSLLTKYDLIKSEKQDKALKDTFFLVHFIIQCLLVLENRYFFKCHMGGGGSKNLWHYLLIFLKSVTILWQKRGLKISFFDGPHKWMTPYKIQTF